MNLLSLLDYIFIWLRWADSHVHVAASPCRTLSAYLLYIFVYNIYIYTYVCVCALIDTMLDFVSTSSLQLSLYATMLFEWQPMSHGLAGPGSQHHPGHLRV